MKLMNQKLTKYTWLLPFISGICWGAAGIFVRTLEHDGLDNFSIISFRMLLAALITAYGFYSITDIYFMYTSVTSGFLSEAA